MSTTTIQVSADDIIETRRSVWQATLHFCRREPLGAFGMLIVIIMVVTGLSAELIAPYSPTSNDFAAMTEAPS
jgi:peptide/nickel transport system permease protein